MDINMIANLSYIVAAALFIFGLKMLGRPRAEVAASQGYLGRSLGCPAVDDRVSAALIDAIAGGTLLFSWYPDGDWSQSSRYLR